MLLRRKTGPYQPLTWMSAQTGIFEPDSSCFGPSLLAYHLWVRKVIGEQGSGAYCTSGHVWTTKKMSAVENSRPRLEM